MKIAATVEQSVNSAVSELLDKAFSLCITTTTLFSLFQQLFQIPTASSVCRPGSSGLHTSRSLSWDSKFLSSLKLSNHFQVSETIYPVDLPSLPTAKDDTFWGEVKDVFWLLPSILQSGRKSNLSNTDVLAVKQGRWIIVDYCCGSASAGNREPHSLLLTPPPAAG